MVVTLEDVKEQCNIDLDFHDHDNILHRYIKSAEANVAQRLRYNTLDEAFPDGCIPDTVIHAVLIIAATSYENREHLAPVQLHKVPETLDALLGPYVRYCEQKEVKDESGIDA